MRYAWINTVTSGPSGMSAEIWFTEPNKAGAEPFDAATLAQDCVDSWKWFIWPA